VDRFLNKVRTIWLNLDKMYAVFLSHVYLFMIIWDHISSRVKETEQFKIINQFYLLGFVDHY